MIVDKFVNSASGVRTGSGSDGAAHCGFGNADFGLAVMRGSNPKSAFRNPKSGDPVATAPGSDLCRPTPRLGGLRFALHLIRLRRDAKVRLDSLPSRREFLLGLFVRHCRNDDAVVAVFPVDRSRDAVLRGELK